jgi:hypothetical protein
MTLAALSVVLVNPYGRATVGLRHIPFRTCEVSDVTAAEDVVIVYGPGAGRCVQTLATRLGGAMPRVAVIAPYPDRDDMRLALAYGVTTYLVEGPCAGFLGSCLAEVLFKTSAGVSCLDPSTASVVIDQLREGRRLAPATSAPANQHHRRNGTRDRRATVRDHPPRVR